MTRKLVLVACVCVSCLWAMHYDRRGAVTYANTWADFWGGRYDGFKSYFAVPNGGDCCKFMSRTLNNDSGGRLHLWGVKDTVVKLSDCREVRISEYDTTKFKHLGKLDKEGHFTSCHELKVCLQGLGVTFAHFTLDDLVAWGVPAILDVGDLIFMDPDDSGNDQHVMMVDSINRQADSIYVDDHHGTTDSSYFLNYDLLTYFNKYNAKQKNQNHLYKDANIAHIPDVIRNCSDLKQIETCDSNVGSRPKIRFGWAHCCWHELLGGQSPWTSDPTPYACLSWAETSGTTYDSLIMPRINLAGCSCAVAVWACTTNLYSRPGRRAKVLGSTDDGSTWTELGSDTLDSVNMSWASNQPKVRLAFVYDGRVMKDTFWCIDHFRVFAKPTRDTDVSVSEIRVPDNHGSDSVPILIPGSILRPKAIVWNSGRHDAGLWFTFKIDGGATYADSEWMNLFPTLDTCIQFAPWTVTVGPHTAVCYASLPGDECSANDTVRLSFCAVSDTWMRESKVYGGNGLSASGCLATVDTDEIYCVPGASKAFADYIVHSDLWYKRAPTIKTFGNGAGMTYPDSGNYLYALKGGISKLFYRYSLTDSTWDTLRRAPFNVGAGGALAYGGDGCIYALRGSRKTNFSRYNISGDSWQSRAATLDTIGVGGSLVWTRGDSLYALRGLGHPNFYRYLTSTNSWTRLTSLPVNESAGGALAYNPLGDKIYAFAGGRRDSFYVYDIRSNSWSRRHKAPNKVRIGAKLAYCNHAVYAGLGSGAGQYLWRYSPEVGDFTAGREAGSQPDGQAEGGVGPRLGVSDGRLDPGELLTFDPTDKCTPKYSPDGFWIAYTAYDSVRDCNGLYRVPAVGGLANPMTQDSASYEDPEWASNGAWLVAATDDGIYKVVNGGPIQLLAQGCVSNPHVSPGDSWVIFDKWDPAAHTHHVNKVRSIGGADTCLTPSADEYPETQPVSASDFACVKIKGDAYQLSRDSAGQERWLTSDYMDNVGLNISPNKQWLTYEKLDESGFWQVYKMRVNGTQETRVTDGTCNCETPVFSPDGRYIAYTKWPEDSTGASEYSQVCYKDTGSSAVEVPLNAADAERENPCWSPDCRYIIYTKVVATAQLGPGGEQHKQIGRVRTRIKSLSGVEELSRLPRAFALEQNKPNPFSHATVIRYALPMPSFTELSIFDATGRTVTRLVQSEQKPGYYAVNWNGKDARGRSVAAGTYFYVLKSDKKIAQKRMLLIR